MLPYQAMMGRMMSRRADPLRKLDESEIHDILRNDRRRRIIRRLRDVDGTVSVNDLSEHIASVESGEDPAPRNVRKSVYVSLHQTHLPKLDEWGVIDYDPQSKDLHLNERVEEVVVYMEVLSPVEIPWGMYYLGLGVLALLTLVQVRMGLFYPEQLTIEFWSWFFLILLTLSALYQTLTTRKQKLVL